MTHGLIKKLLSGMAALSLLILIPGCCWSCCKKESDVRPEVRQEQVRVEDRVDEELNDEVLLDENVK